MRSDIAILLVIGAALFAPPRASAAAPAGAGAPQSGPAPIEQVAKQQLVIVPNVVKLTRQQAETVLLQNGLKLGSVTEVPPDPDSSVGAVVWQNPPAASRVAPGTAVNIRVVAQWPNTGQLKGLAIPATAMVRVKVPRLIGLDVGAATKTAEGSRLHLGTLTQVPSDRTAGTVIGQNPTEGTVVFAGTAVDVTVSTQAPQKIVVAVPNLTNMTIEEARGRLAEVRLRLRAVEPAKMKVPPGAVPRVVSQAPTAGTEVEPGSGVIVTVRPVTVPPVLVEVPRLVGQQETDVAALLKPPGLVIGWVQRRPDVRPRGTVIEQKPARGSSVPRGTAIDIVVVDPQLVVVPALVMQPLNAARQLCSKAGLQIASVRRQSDARQGTVISQTPQAGERIALGSIVRVVVAVPVAPPPQPPNPPDRTEPPEVTIAVPDLVGLRLSEAQRVTSSIGLGIQLTSEMSQSRADKRNIVSQDPPAGSQVRRATLVAVRLGPAPFPTVLIVGGLAALGLAGVLLWHWRKAAVPPAPPATAAPLRVDISGASPASELEAGGGLVDLELRIDVKRDPGWTQSEMEGASIIRETQPGSR